ncbi:MAG TPA: carbohydrate porin [Acidobacteriaceae bacterium]|jgi:carbohydrate-selective porin OprB|nr:carbohydrate porin [Acidobacteriaceae bacterium]
MLNPLRRPLFLTPTLLLFALHPYAFGQTPAANPAPPASGSLLNGFATPARTLHQLAQHGVSFQYLYVHDLSKAPLALPDSQNWFGRYSWDITSTIDAAKALGWNGGSAFLDLKQHTQEYGSVYTSASQGYSNIDAPSRTVLYQAWAQQLLFNNRLRLKAGRIDANTDFAGVSTAADFLNSSMGFSPTIMEFPTYPQPKMGADLAVAATKSTQISAGLFGTNNGKMELGEVSQAWTLGASQNPGRVALGIWQLREPLHCFRGDDVSGTQGLYLITEQSLWRRVLSEKQSQEQRLSAFLQIGDGDGKANPFTQHLGGGLVFSAPFRRRPSDAAGAAVTRVVFTRDLCDYDAHQERALEAYYKFSLSRTLSLVSDVQYFQHPGGILANRNTLIATPRLVVSF